jgi:hypothetical protein
MRRIGILLVTVVLGVLLSAGPALAAGHPKKHDPGSSAKRQSSGPPGHASARANRDSVSGSAVDETPDGPPASNSGRGMNRQGGPGKHPGEGWKDPGQDQGSPHNRADPDCTGNRTVHPQATNIGACDNVAGAADKPGGSGGFDADRDWNNGCGNDTDFEDDNNGQCRGPHRAERPRPRPRPKPRCEPRPRPRCEPRPRPDCEPRPRPHPGPRPRPRTEPPRGPRGPVGNGGPPVQGSTVLPRVELPRSIPPGPTLPATGRAATDLVQVAMGLIGMGTLLVGWTRRPSR